MISTDLRCRNCKSNQLTWDCWYITTVPPIGNRIDPPKIFIACDACSDMVKILSLEDVVEMLNKTDTRI